MDYDVKKGQSFMFGIFVFGIHPSPQSIDVKNCERLKNSEVFEMVTPLPNLIDLVYLRSLKL